VAVYKRTYSAYQGSFTPAWSRFMILPRYSFSGVWQSRFLAMFRIAALFYPVGCGAYIYASHNLSFLAAFQVPAAAAGNFLQVTPHVFLYYCWAQGFAAYILTAFVGPTLVSPDLVNGALPLYLGRPFSRKEYVLGKMSVLLYLLSAITWVPGLILWGIQASLAGWDWAVDNLWIAGALFVGLMVWIVVLSLIALALSAWVKWKIAAGGLLLGVFFGGTGFGTAINAIMRTSKGTLINLTEVIYTIWTKLFRYEPDSGVSAGSAWIVLGVVGVLCLWLLMRRVRAFEVIK
jgi:ABC-2 type transport system permease protein